ncbi:hypothetical protein AYO38_05035 [bacterium SCGC AG-212-C10]|nr:hypothetical protein AYO38_05035 [bacterium SCGC AG-212-C10]
MSVLCLIAVAAVALIGVAQTLWFEDMKLNAEVATGNLDAKIVCGTNAIDNDGIDVNNDGIGDLAIADIEGYPNPIPLKDVGTSSGTQATPPAGGNPHAYVITVTNAYPGYAVDCELELRNQGTVPWHVESTALVVKKDGVPIVTYSLDCDGTNCTWGDISPTLAGSGHSDVYFELVEDPSGCQVHTKWATSLILGINQNASEDAIYTFELAFQVNQWNESAWISCNNPI